MGTRQHGAPIINIILRWDHSCIHLNDLYRLVV
jgi:hypothetical protein